MDKDQKFWICIIAIIATAVVLFATSINYFYTKRMVAYVSNGFCETTAPGYSGAVMQKCE